MDTKEHIKNLFKQIEIYHSHALHQEAAGKCYELADLIRTSREIKNKEDLLRDVGEKLIVLENDARTFNNDLTSSKMSTQELNLVKKLFSFSGKQYHKSANPEVATAYLIMGQYEKALSEFDALMKIARFRGFAAKNILRCHIRMASLDDAILQYNIWRVSGQFSYEELVKLYSFLLHVISKRQIDKSLPKPDLSENGNDAESQEDEFLDLVTVTMLLPDGSGKDRPLTLDIEFQKETVFSVILPEEDKDLIEVLSVGKVLKNVEFVSTSVVFTENCVVSDKRVIEKGARKGQYFVVMKVLESLG